MKSLKALEEELFSKRDHCCNAEANNSELELELDNLKKEVKSLGKCKASPAPYNWHTWGSELDGASDEQGSDGDANM